MNNARMRVTRNTLDAEITTPVERARRCLVEDAKNEAISATEIVSSLNAMSEAEGVARAQYTFREALTGMLDLGHPEQEATDYAKEAMTALLLAGQDDTWSGRKNDVRRAFADGVREAAGFLIRGY